MSEDDDVLTPTAMEAFAAHQHIKHGDWDRFLNSLLVVIQQRIALYNPRRTPKTVLPEGQVWAWIFDAAGDHWEPRGTGVEMESSE